MVCRGSINGKCCPRQYSADPTNPDDLHKVSGLHLDHSVEFYLICMKWLEVIGKRHGRLRSWDQGINGDLICQLLFGVEEHPNYAKTGNSLWKANVHLRCGRPQGKRGHGNYCHDEIHRHCIDLEASDLRL